MKYFDDKHVCINAVAPGFIETPWQKDRTDESRQRINAKIAAHRFGTPQEVAAMAISILKNNYVNGTVVEVTGDTITSNVVVCEEFSYEKSHHVWYL